MNFWIPATKADPNVVVSLSIVSFHSIIMLGPSLVMMDHPVTRQWNGNTTVTKAFFHKRFSETAQKYFRTRIDSCFRFLVAFIKPSSIVECGI